MVITPVEKIESELKETYRKHRANYFYNMKDFLSETWSDIVNLAEKYRAENPVISTMHEALMKTLRGELDEEKLIQLINQAKVEIDKAIVENPMTPKQYNLNLALSALFWWVDLILFFLSDKRFSTLAMILSLEKPIQSCLENVRGDNFLDEVRKIDNLLKEYYSKRDQEQPQGQS